MATKKAQRAIKAFEELGVHIFRGFSKLVFYFQQFWK